MYTIENPVEFFKKLEEEIKKSKSAKINEDLKYQIREMNRRTFEEDIERQRQMNNERMLRRYSYY